jgi:hypothetical protein
MESIQITNHQQRALIIQRATEHSKTVTICGYGLAKVPPVFQVGWSDCKYFIFLSFYCSFLLLIGISECCCTHEDTVPCRCSNPDALSEGGRCLFCCARHLRTASSMQLIAISRNLVPFDRLTWEVITQKRLFSELCPAHLWAPERPRTVDPTNQDFSWGSGKWYLGDVACPSKKSTIVLCNQCRRAQFKGA